MRNRIKQTHNPGKNGSTEYCMHFKYCYIRWRVKFFITSFTYLAVAKQRGKYLKGYVLKVYKVSAVPFFNLLI